MPWQVSFAGGCTNVLISFDVIFTESFPLHPLAAVPVTINKEDPIELPVNTGLAKFGLFNPDAGLQVYVFAPVVVSVIDCPLQMAVSGIDFTTGIAFTVTTIVSFALQPLAAVPVTNTVCEVFPVKIGFAIPGLFTAVAGNQLYVWAPVVVSKSN